MLAACSGGGSGGSCPSYASITGGSFVRTGADLVWTLDVEGLPAVTFNKPDVPESVLEYRWGVELDGNRDGATDLRVAATHYKTSAPSVTSADVVANTQHDVWQVTSSGVGVIVGDADVTVAGTRFTFATNDREDPALANITDAGQATWFAYVFEGPSFDDVCEDSFTP
jgi:hypothetical protein